MNKPKSPCYQESDSFYRLIAAVEAFFHRMIVTYDMKQNLIEEACKKLGERHQRYAKRGFEISHWDLFMVLFSLYRIF